MIADQASQAYTGVGVEQTSIYMHTNLSFYYMSTSQRR